MRLEKPTRAPDTVPLPRASYSLRGATPLDRITPFAASGRSPLPRSWKACGGVSQNEKRSTLTLPSLLDANRATTLNARTIVEPRNARARIANTRPRGSWRAPPPRRTPHLSPSGMGHAWTLSESSCSSSAKTNVGSSAWNKFTSPRYWRNMEGPRSGATRRKQIFRREPVAPWTTRFVTMTTSNNWFRVCSRG